MRAIFMLAALAVAVPDRVDPAPRAKPKTVEERLIGEWRVEKMEIAGGLEPPRTELETRTLRFTPTEILVKVNGEPRPADGAGYQLDTAKKPVAIDLMPGQGPDKKLEGILKLDGDQLTICFSIAGGRPTAFASTPQPLQAVLHLKRIR